MNHSLGKLANKDSGKSLSFSIAPSDFTLNRSFDFSLEPCLGQPAPMVSFRCGGISQISFSLLFDKDADKDCDFKTIDSFLHELNVIKEDTKSPPPLEFAMGSFTFKGYALAFTFNASRFDDHGEITSAKLDMKLISNGDYEREKSTI